MHLEGMERDGAAIRASQALLPDPANSGTCGVPAESLRGGRRRHTRSRSSVGSALSQRAGKRLGRAFLPVIYNSVGLPGPMCRDQSWTGAGTTFHLQLVEIA